MFYSNSLNSKLDVNPGEVFWKASMSLVLASKLAYQNSDRIKSEGKKNWGFTDVYVFNSKADFIDTQAFVALNKDIAIISFRGTQSGDDWLVDFNPLIATTIYGDVREGFYEAYMAVKSDIEQCLRLVDWGKCKLWITGHSLGGALAMVAAAELPDQYGASVSGLFTYGQPRVGFSKLCKFMNKNYANRYYRFVNNEDIVPRLPPLYSHAGKLIHFDASGKVKAASLALDAAEMEQPELTQDQFLELKEEIGKWQASGGKLDDETFDEGKRDLGPGGPVADKVLNPAPKFIQDHYLGNYIAAINQQIDNGA